MPLACGTVPSMCCMTPASTCTMSPHCECICDVTNTCCVQVVERNAHLLSTRSAFVVEQAFVCIDSLSRPTPEEEASL